MSLKIICIFLTHYRRFTKLIQIIDTTFTFTVKAKSSKLPQADKSVESSTTALKDYVVAHRIAYVSFHNLLKYLCGMKFLLVRD